MFANYTAELEEFPISPINSTILHFVGWYMSFLLAFTFAINWSLLATFIGTKELRKPINTFVISITVLNLVGCILEFPFVVGSAFSCRWIFNHIGCALSAYLMYFVGCSSTYLMAAISVERYYTIYNPMSMRNMTFKKSIIMVQLCLILGIFWPTMPLVGWSHYGLESGLVSCSVTWHEDSFSVKTYNIAIFLFVYIIPVFVIFCANLKLILIIKKMPNMAKNEQDEKIKKKIEREKRITKIMIFYILLFCLTWTPYAIVAMWSALVDAKHIPPVAATLPAVFAKSSMLWSPMFFIFTNQGVKKKMVTEYTTMFKAKESSFTNDISKAKKSDSLNVSN